MFLELFVSETGSCKTRTCFISSSLLVMTKKLRRQSLSVSRFSPDVAAQDVNKSPEDQLKFSSVASNSLKTKFDV